MVALADNRLGAYLLEGRVAYDDLLEVYQATHPKLGTPVVVQVIRPQWMRGPATRAAFAQLAASLAALRHPNIPRVYDYGIEEGLGYLVLEQIEGQTLAERVAELCSQGKVMPLREALDWIDGLFRALDFAHQRGVLHRCLSPDQIVMRDGGEPAVLGFGLRFLLHPPSPDQEDKDAPYRAPEIAAGDLGDARSDVYSLGAVLLEMLSGIAPEPDDPERCLKARARAGRRFSPGLEQVLRNAIARDPLARTESVRALARDMFGVVRGERPLRRPPPAAESREVKPAPPAKPARREAIRQASPRPKPPPPPTPSVAPPQAAPPAPEPSHSRPVEDGNPRAWRGALAMVLAMTALLALGWWGTAWVRARTAPSAGAPRFSVGTEVRVSVAGGTSVSVLRGCPTEFWQGVLGIATDGQTGLVEARRDCDGEWWYQVRIPALQASEWDGVGWVDEKHLEPR